MSVKRVFTLACDLCHTEDDGNAGWWASEVRQAAKDDGWKRIKGQDVCPCCQGVTA